nr:hypothetical protein [Sorangium cellulosum]
MSRPRIATSRTASSRLRTPATCAAATSPTLCPITASGVTPFEARSADSATWTPKIASCATSVRSRRALASALVSSSRREKPACCLTSASHASSAARKTGSSPSSSRPMPIHCDPCPENTKTSRVRAAWLARPCATPARGSPATNARSDAASSSRERATSAARCSWWLRRTAAV